MASENDLHLLGIGYRHVKGGEEQFAAAGDRVRGSAREVAASVSAVDAALESMAAQMAGASTAASASAGALARDVAALQAHRAAQEQDAAASAVRAELLQRLVLSVDASAAAEAASVDRQQALMLAKRVLDQEYQAGNLTMFRHAELLALVQARYESLDPATIAAAEAEAAAATAAEARAAALQQLVLRVDGYAAAQAAAAEATAAAIEEEGIINAEYEAGNLTLFRKLELLELLRAERLAQDPAALQAAKREREIADASTAASAGLLKQIAAFAGFAGAIAVFAALTGFIHGAVTEWREHDQAMRQVEAGLASTAGAAGLTASQLDELANSVSRLSKFEDDQVLSAESVLLTFDRINSQAFPTAIRLSADLATRFGMDLSEAARTVGKALQDPAEGLVALSRLGIRFTDDQKRVIQSLVDSGHRLQAQGLILGELGSRIGGSAEAGRDGLDELRLAIKGLEGAVGSELGPALANLAGLVADLIGAFSDTGSLSGFGEELRALSDMLYIARFGLRDLREELESFGAAASVVYPQLAPLFGLLTGGGAYAGIHDLAEDLRKANAVAAQIRAATQPKPDFSGTDPEGLEEARKKAALERAKAILEEGKALAQANEQQGLAARSAEELAAAYRRGLPAFEAATRQQAIQAAMAPALAKHQLYLAAALGQWAARQYDATRALAIEQDARQRSLALSTEEAAARARVTDALEGNNEATTRAAREAAVLAFQERFNLDAGNKLVVSLRAQLRAHDDVLKKEAERERAAKRRVAADVEIRTAQAALDDEVNRSAAASRELAIQLEIEARVREDGKKGNAAATAEIERNVRARHEQLDIINAGTQALQLQHEAEAELARQQAGYADAQQYRDAVRQWGRELADVLQKYGLLSDASKKLAIDEHTRAILSQKDNVLTEAQIRAQLEAQQAAADAAASAAAAQEYQEGQAQRALTAWADVFRVLSEQLGGTATQVGRVASSFVDLIEALSKVKAAGKAWSAEMASAIAGTISAIGQLLKDLDVGASNKTGGPSQFGGKLPGNYAAVGTIVGTIIGAIVGYFAAGIGVAAGAQIGAVLGGVLGAMITKAGDSASAELRDGGSIVQHETSEKLNGAVRDALLGIWKGLNTELAKLGLYLTDLPFIDVKVRDNIVRVIVGGVTRTFSSMRDAISFGIAEALKQAGTLGNLPPEVRQVLEHTTATSLEELQSDIAFAQSIANYGVPKVVQSIDKAVSDFFVAMQRAAELGIDSTKVIAQFADQLQAQRDQLLGIDRTKSPEDQLRADVEAFNQRLELLRAEQEAKKADLLVKRAQLEAELRIAQAELQSQQASLNARAIMAEASGAIASAELEAVNALVSALAAVDVALASVQAVLDHLPDLISNEELQAALARLRHAGGGGGRQQSPLAQAITESEENRRTATLGEQSRAVYDVNKKWDDLIAGVGLHSDALARATREHDRAIRAAHGNADAIRKANEEYAREQRNIERSTEEIERANAARRAELELVRDQVNAAARQYLPPSQGGTLGQSQWDSAAAEVGKTFDDLAAAAEELRKAGVAGVISQEELAAAEHNALRQVAQDAIASLNLPMQQLRQRTSDLRATLDFLRRQMEAGVISAGEYGDVLAETAAQATSELYGLAASILDQMGQTKEAEALRAALAEANFDMQVIQLHFLYDQYVALGLVSDEVAERMQRLFGIIDDPANRPHFGAPPAGGGGDRVYHAYEDQGQQASDDARRRQEILDQIAAWNRLGDSEFSTELRGLNDVFVSMRADAARLGISLTDLMAAHAHAVEDFWNRTLAPYEHTDNLLDQLAELNRRFDDMIAAAEEFGGDQERIEAARLAEIRRFWDEALQPIRELRDTFDQGAQGQLSPEQRLLAAQQRFNDLAQRALAGDASAIQALPAAVQALLDQQRAFSGTGPAYQALVQTIQAVLDQILALGGSGTGTGRSGTAPPTVQAGLAPITYLPAAAPAGSGVPYAPAEGPQPRPVALAPVGGTQRPQGQEGERQRVDELTAAMARDLDERRIDRQRQRELMDRIELLARTVESQQAEIARLSEVVRRLTGLVESQERRAS